MLRSNNKKAQKTVPKVLLKAKLEVEKSVSIGWDKGPWDKGHWANRR